MINPDQRDVLLELMNIGFGRVADSLSRMLGRRIVLRVPELAVVQLTQLRELLSDLSHKEAAIIHQNFHGGMQGDALLLLDSSDAPIVIDLIGGGQAVHRGLLPSDQEALKELGNILLAAYVGNLASLLQMRATFSVPHAHIIPVRQLHNLLQYELMMPGDMVVMVVKATFQITETDITGYLFLIIRAQTMREVLERLDRFTELEGG